MVICLSEEGIVFHYIINFYIITFIIFAAHQKVNDLMWKYMMISIKKLNHIHIYQLIIIMLLYNHWFIENYDML